MTDTRNRETESIGTKNMKEEETDDDTTSGRDSDVRESRDSYGGVHVPKVIGGSSRILTIDERINVAAGLPYECRDYNWQLEYSSNMHGLSWHTLHRCIANTGSNIVVVRTTEGEVMGGYCTQSWIPNGEYVGTGECVVFQIKPGNFKLYNWTGKNSYFMLSNPTMMAMGGGGDFAFQIDGSFKGITGESETFGNRSLLNSGKRDFQVFDIEVSYFFLNGFFCTSFFFFFHLPS